MRILKHLIIIFFCFASINSFATPFANKQIPLFAHQAITQLMQKDHIPGVAVELYVNGKMYSDYNGYANLATKQRVTGNTIFEIGSITKVFTSLVLAQQVEKNIVRLHSPISHFMQTAQLRGITLENLATHTAGFPPNLPSQVNTYGAFWNYLDHYQTPYAPGSTWIYSNVSFGALGYVLEHITHESINQMYRQDILAPLHMKPIGMMVPKKYQANYAQGYVSDANPVAHSPIGIIPSAYAIKVSGNDMQQFLKAALLLPSTPKIILRAMRLTETPYYNVANPNMLQGLGWQMFSISQNTDKLLHVTAISTPGTFPVTLFTHYTQNDNALLIEKTGLTNGFSTYIAIIPKYHVGIVILANRSVKNGDIVNTARHILFNLASIQ